MGPLFAFAFLAIIAGFATFVVFIVAVIYLPIRSALLFALAFVGAGIVGCAFGVLIQLSFLRGDFGTTFAVLRFLGIIGTAGCACSIVAAFLFLRLRRVVLARLGVTVVARQALLFD